MNTVYAVTTDSFCNKESIRNSYMIAKGPYDEQDKAEKEMHKLIKDIERMYKSTETDNRKFFVRSLSDGISFLLMKTAHKYEPIMRCSVIEVNMATTTSCKNIGLESSVKKGSPEHTARQKKFKKANQYIASLVPPKVTDKEIAELISPEKGLVNEN